MEVCEGDTEPERLFLAALVTNTNVFKRFYEASAHGLWLSEDNDGIVIGNQCMTAEHLSATMSDYGKAWSTARD